MSAWIEVNLDNLKNNIKIVREKVGSDVKILAVVKADGYGHGATQIAKCCVKQGVDILAVARIQEGIELRIQGIESSILVMGAILPEQVCLINKYSLTPTVFDISLARHLEQIGRISKKKLKCHVRVDVGSTSFGVTSEDGVHFIKGLLKMQWLEVEGVFTHLSSAYRNDQKLIEMDLAKFNRLLTSLEADGISIPLVHAVSSPGIIKVPKAYYNMVRSGTCLYGMPSFKDQEDWGLKPLMQLKAKIVAIKEQQEGQVVGYGNSFQVANTTRLATVSIGYADSMFLFFLQKGNVLVCNKLAPIFGRAYMSHLVIDVTHIPEAEVGHEVVILGKQGGQVISVEELANQAEFGTTYCDLICLLSKTLPRTYIEETVGK